MNFNLCYIVCLKVNNYLKFSYFIQDFHCQNYLVNFFPQIIFNKCYSKHRIYFIDLKFECLYYNLL
jgi:hypothetical protein